MTDQRRTGPAFGEAGRKDLISIQNGDLTARIDRNGGILDEFMLTTDDKLPTDLIFSRQNLDTPEGPKMRGGSHVCLPLFGEAAGLQRHGFGRDLPWHSLKRDFSTQAFYVAINNPALVPGADHYQGLEAIMTYRIDDDPTTHNHGRDLFMNLSLRVGNDKQEPITGIAPGFHPYIALPEGLRADQLNLNIGGQQWRFSAEELRSTVMVDTNNSPVEVGLGKSTLEITQQNLPIFAIWTDNPEAYICIEPTAAGTVALEELTRHILNPGEIRTYSAAFSWKTTRAAPRN